MSKGRRSHQGTKEYTGMQRMRHEMERLKRENARLRKELSRVDLDRYHDILELVHKNDAEEASQKSRKKDLEGMKKEWACHECDEGYLKILLIPRLDGTFYFRKCSNKACHNRTKTQRYTSDVRGIKDDDQEG